MIALLRVAGWLPGVSCRGLERDPPSCPSLSCSLHGGSFPFPRLLPHPGLARGLSSESRALPALPRLCPPGVVLGSDAAFGARGSCIGTRWPQQALPAFRVPGMGTPPLLLLTYPPPTSGTFPNISTLWYQSTRRPCEADSPPDREVPSTWVTQAVVSQKAVRPYALGTPFPSFM